MTDFAEANLETFDFLIDVNLKNCVLCSHEVVAGMIARGSGKIVHVASESAVNGSPRCWDYSAAKAGVIGFTRAIAREFAPHGITVKGMIDAIIAKIPAHRIAEPEDVANVILFFASGASDYVTGQALLVNGGTWMP